MITGGRRLPGPGTRLAGRAFDLAALAVVAFLAWKLLVAPRVLAPASERAPRIALPAAAGGIYRLGEPAGRVVFLDFWASWCEPCRLSLPIVEAFARAHPDVDVVAVDVGEAPEVATLYAREHGIGRVVFDRPGRAAATLGVLGFPTLVAIDPAGFVRARWTGFNPAIGAAMQHAREVLAARPPASSR